MRLIDASVLREAVEHIPWCEYWLVQEVIDKQPTVDAEPVRHAHWVDDGPDPSDPDSGNNCYHCSCCLHGDLQSATTEVPYCWYCGCKMDEDV